MLLVRLWNYLRGYVIIMANGPFLERFINICASRRIFLWDVKPAGDGSINLKTSIKGFKSVRPAARKSHTKVRLRGKKGLPFLVKRFRKRKAFVAGLITFLVLINLLTSFVWVVEIDGCENLTADAVKNELALLGIKPGVFKYRVDPNRAAGMMMLVLKDIAWISVEISGTKAKVNLKEVTKPPELVDLDTPCDIIAACDGMITNIVVRHGSATVKEGDTVSRGQVLISGTIPANSPGNAATYIHAIGNIKARTWYERIAAIKYTVSEKVRTGKSSSGVRLVVFGKEFGIWGKQVPFTEYETDVKEKMISLGKDMVLPFGFVSIRHCELENHETELPAEEAREKAIQDSLSALMAEMPESAKIVKQDIYSDAIDDQGRPLSVRIVIECLEEIGVPQGLSGSDTENTNEIGGE